MAFFKSYVANEWIWVRVGISIKNCKNIILHFTCSTLALDVTTCARFAASVNSWATAKMQAGRGQLVVTEPLAVLLLWTIFHALVGRFRLQLKLKLFFTLIFVIWDSFIYSICPVYPVCLFRLTRLSRLSYLSYLSYLFYRLIETNHGHEFSSTATLNPALDITGVFTTDTVLTANGGFISLTILKSKTPFLLRMVGEPWAFVDLER